MNANQEFEMINQEFEPFVFSICLRLSNIEIKNIRKIGIRFLIYSAINIYLVLTGFVCISCMDLL